MLLPVVALTAALLGLLVGSGSSQAQTTGSALSPVVQRTGKLPTGYTVTFRYRNPGATSVYLWGEWYFSSPGHASPYSSQGLVPTQWEPGDFPLGWPNIGTTAGWPLSNMAEDRRTGVWSYTTPLPSGEFNYAFAVDCTDAEMGSASGCPMIPDPSNPSWNDHDGMSLGSVEPDSQVYVPSDPSFHTVDYWWQAPTSPHGALSDVTYSGLSSASSTSPGPNYLAIYTPPHYDPNRSAPYPTLYLSAGYVSNEVDWSTRADAANIVDNLIDRGEVKPMVVVMTNFAWAAFGEHLADGVCLGGPYDQNLVSRVIPYVQSHYDVSREPAQRAFAGLSCGGGLAVSLLLDDTTEFGYYGAFSPAPASLHGLTASQVSAINKVGVLVGGGKDDPIHSYAQADVSSLKNAGIRFVSDFVNGGHDWYVWRALLHDFLERVAFRPAGV